MFVCFTVSLMCILTEGERQVVTQALSAKLFPTAVIASSNARKHRTHTHTHRHAQTTHNQPEGLKPSQEIEVISNIFSECFSFRFVFAKAGKMRAVERDRTLKQIHHTFSSHSKPFFL